MESLCIVRTDVTWQNHVICFVLDAAAVRGTDNYLIYRYLGMAMGCDLDLE